jgi:glycosyltransferase involved in cell wall biosynthesis
MVENKKILHVVNISFVLPYYIGDQFDYFSAKGIKFHVACQPSAHFLEYSIEKNFIPYQVNILRQINVFEDLKAIYLLVKYIKKEGIDIVVGHTPKGGLIGMLAAYIAGINKRIYFRHGIMFETSRGAKQFILKTIERFTGFLATKVVCVSQSVIDFSNNKKLSAPYKNLLLNKGTCNGIDGLNKFNRGAIDATLLSNLRKRYNISSKDRVVGFVGRLVNDKGINELILAWKELLKGDSNLKLLLIGPFELRDTIPEITKSYILNTPTIIHTGLIEDIAPYYALMNIFILPSYREGFPTSVLEASAMGVPVLTTKVTGCRDSIIENETGIFIDLNPTDIVKKLKIYIDNPALASKYGQNGRDFVLKNFAQHKIWEEIEEKVFEG